MAENILESMAESDEHSGNIHCSQLESLIDSRHIKQSTIDKSLALVGLEHALYIEYRNNRCYGYKTGCDETLKSLLPRYTLPLARAGGADSQFQFRIPNKQLVNLLAAYADATGILDGAPLPRFSMGLNSLRRPTITIRNKQRRIVPAHSKPLKQASMDRYPAWHRRRSLFSGIITMHSSKVI